MIKAPRIRLPVIILKETASACLVARQDDRRCEAWVPKSLVAIEDERSDGTAMLLITQALAETRRLISRRQWPNNRGGQA